MADLANGDPMESAMKKARLAGAAEGGDPTSVPVVDIAPFFRAGAKTAELDAVAAAVQAACEEVGFLVVVGHGIDEALPKACTEAAYEFFGRPEAEKAKVAANGRAYGFFPLASEALGYDADVGKRPDIREAFSMGPQEPLPPASSPDRPGGPAEVVEFCYQQTPWPSDGDNGSTSLRQAMQAYYGEAAALADRLLRIFARALHVDSESMLEKTVRHASSLRVIHYPALTAAPLPGQLRCGDHSDICTMTLLWQDIHGGLEVLPRGSARWLEVQCPPGGLIVNLGDLFARWTNDRWMSTPHQVSCPEIAYQKPRISMPFFQILRSDAEVTCLETCLDAGDEAKYVPITQGEDLRNHFKRWGRNRE